MAMGLTAAPTKNNQSMAANKNPVVKAAAMMYPVVLAVRVRVVAVFQKITMTMIGPRMMGAINPAAVDVPRTVSVNSPPK